MKVLERLTLANLRENKRRTGVTIIGVMLSTALILAVAGIVTSFQQMMVDWAKVTDGDYHEMYQEVSVDDLKLIEENQHVESYYYSKPLTREQLGEDFDTYEVYQHAGYPLSAYEKLETLPENASGTYNIYVRYDHPGDYQTYRDQLSAVLEQQTGHYINYRTNSDLLRYEAGAMSDATLAALYSMAAIVIGIIIVTSIFVIRNSFSISATERARQFGMLSSIGATPKQIRHSVIFEGIAVAAIGIPLGILLGVAAVAVLILIMNALIGDMLLTGINFAMPFWIFPVAILLSFLIVLLSSLMPAIRASRISPIEAIRGNQDTKIKAKKLRTSKIIRSTFGIGGVIASKNLKRSRKKYRTTVISIVISIATFIGLSSFLGYGQDTVGMQFGETDLDFMLGGGDPTLYQELVNRFDIKDYVYYEGTHALEHNFIAMNPEAFTEFAKSVGVNTKDYSKVAIMNDYGMVSDNGSYKVERIFPDIHDGDTISTEVITSRKIENAIEDETGAHTGYDTESKNYDVTITKITDARPLGFEYYFGNMTFVSSDYYLLDQLIPDPDAYQFMAKNIDNAGPIVEYIEGLEESGRYEHLYATDVKASISGQRRLMLMISIFLYGFVIVVTLIGVTNIFNTITTNIALRAKEFAMLRSVGMTSYEFNRMVRLESLMYISKALIIGLPLGVLLSYGFYQSFALAVDFGYKFPFVPTLISIVAVAILIGVIMHYSVKQVSKQNIIETIRSENI